VRIARGGPGDFERRYARAAAIEPSAGSAEPLALLIAVLGHQRRRAASPEVRAAAARLRAEAAPQRMGAGAPLLHLEEAVEPIVAELAAATGSLARPAHPVPVPLDESREELEHLAPAGRPDLVAAWLRDPSLVDPRFGFWIRLAAAPILEGAAAEIEPPTKEAWSVAFCPACGGPPQVSVIGEESGEFMAGSPRYLVCARCALWWGFARAKCVSCGEDDSRRLGSYMADDERWVRVDVCDTCRSYMKSFDLREPGSRDVVPLVDDVATLTLDLWAHEHGCQRPSLSLAGV
jgi:formate dehydrogenase maturation protein FdhE